MTARDALEIANEILDAEQRFGRFRSASDIDHAMLAGNIAEAIQDARMVERDRIQAAVERHDIPKQFLRLVIKSIREDG